MRLCVCVLFLSILIRIYTIYYYYKAGAKTSRLFSENSEKITMIYAQRSAAVGQGLMAKNGECVCVECCFVFSSISCREVLAFCSFSLRVHL